MILSTKFFCASITYQKLDERALSNLSSASIDNKSEDLKKLKDLLGFETESIAIIKKCNAIIIFLTYQEDFLSDFIRDRLLSSWDALSAGGILKLIREIRFHQGVEALKFLAECSVGIHSVTIGDSQVLTQITDGLEAGIQDDKNLFRTLADWLRSVAENIRQNSLIFNGNTSVERVTCQKLIEKEPKVESILLIGYGRSGKLIGKILSEEHKIRVDVMNRTQIDLSDIGEDFARFLRWLPITKEVDPNEYEGVIIALDHTAETESKIKEILSGFKDDVFIIDISTPSFVSRGTSKKIMTISDISEYAQSNSLIRKNEVGKVKELIAKQIPQVIEIINRSVARAYINSQKRNTFKKLELEKIILASQRHRMYVEVREFLNSKNFIETTTPFIVGVSTDPPKVDAGGTINVQWVNDATAFLRQSNQMYKQILVASGIEKMYEIGPFWRKETHDSYRHLQESLGLDVEIRKPNDLAELYFLACEIITQTYEKVTHDLSLEKRLKFPKSNSDIPILSYHEAIKMLRDNGNSIAVGEDLGLVGEARLGQIIKKAYSSDVFIIKDYPDTIKKFYTKYKPIGLTETFDVIVDGWELVSGAIRETDGSKIRSSMMLSGINPADYEFYISIVDEAEEHGGFCLGLDRLMAKIISKEMVSDAVLFPRTYKQLIP